MDFSREQLQDKNLFELREIARENRVQSPTKLNKEELISQIVEASSQRVKGLKIRPVSRPSKLVDAPRRNAQNDVPEKAAESINEIMAVDETCEEREGILEIHPDGYGFIRVRNCEHSEKDVYVSAIKIRKAGLRQGDMIKGIVKVAYDNKPAALLIINTINGVPAEELRKRPRFDDLVPIYPDERLKLENARSKNDFAIREIDLIAPIGKGQRGMIVSPPKAGKTTLLKKIANSISENYPDVTLMVLLIDERPEEVTDMQRSIKGEVVYSTFDEMPEHHTKAAELLLSRAKRLVENGKDVVILMDSLTRLARAYNLTIPPTGRTLSGGLDPAALHMPKRFFGAARNMREGGSLTILATALVDTGSKMDDVIYEEFKGTGNMELVLDRKLQEKRVFPAIDIQKSGTRREDLLLSKDEQEAVYIMRKALNGMKSDEAVEQILNMFARTANNAEFVQMVKKQKL